MKKLKDTIIPRNTLVLSPIMRKGCTHRSKLRKPRGTVKAQFRKTYHEG